MNTLYCFQGFCQQSFEIKRNYQDIIKVLYKWTHKYKKGKWKNVTSLYLSALDYVYNFVFDLYALSPSYLGVVASQVMDDLQSSYVSITFLLKAIVIVANL